MKTRILVILAIWAISPNIGQSQWVQTNWPDGVGRKVTSLLSSGMDLFAGTFDGGISLSTDNGAHWSEVSNGLGGPPVYTMTSLGTNIFAGTYSGVYLSENQGSSWNASGSSLINFPITVLTLLDSTIFAGTGWGTVFFSADNGTTWSNTSNGLTYPPFVVTSFAVKGSNLFVGVGNSQGMLGGGGVLRTSDNGNTWTGFNGRLAVDDIQALAVQGSYLFAGTYDSGVFRSTDSGNNWQAINSGLPNATHANSFVVIDSDILVGTLNGVFLSNDNGTSWIPVNAGLNDLGMQTFAASGEYLFAGTDSSGVWRIPLSDFGISGVSPVPATQNSLVNYPNPFTQSTTISFTTPESGVANVSVVNILGTEVARIFSGELSAGEHSFSWDASGLPDGMYECLVQMNGSVERVPMVLAK